MNSWTIMKLVGRTLPFLKLKYFHDTHLENSFENHGNILEMICCRLGNTLSNFTLSNFDKLIRL